jgi:hypothetical protein
MSAALVNEIIGWVVNPFYANNGEVSRAHRHLMGPLGGS